MDCCSDCFGKKKKPIKIDSCTNCKSRKKLAKSINKSEKSKTAFCGGSKSTSVSSLQKLYSRNASGQERLIPYTFRIPANVSHFRDIGSRRAKCPPFHLLLDHVVAVVWCLFSTDARDKKQLGISQLEWALYFLRGVKNNTGNHPADVAIAIRTIEDTLMQYYAAMSKLVVRQQAQKKTEDNCETCGKIDSTPKSICGICTNTSLSFLPRKSKSTNYNSNHSMDSQMESILNTSPQFSSTRNNVHVTPVNPATMYTTPENNKYKQNSNRVRYGKYYKSTPKTTMYTTPVNRYSSLSKKSPQESPEGLQNNIVELKSLIAQLSDNDFLKNTESDDAMAELLHGFRQHQVAKIREQMKNLKSIETLLYRNRSDFASSLLNTTSADTHTY